MIKVAGIGLGKNEIAKKVLDEAKNSFVILRSGEGVDGIDFDLSFDDMYDNAQDFDSLYQAMAKRVIDAEKEHGTVLYLVKGDGYFDRSVMELFKIRGDVCFVLGQGYPSVYTVTVSAYEIENVRVLDNSACVKVVEIDSAEIAGDVKLKLMEFYSDEEKVWLFDGNNKKVVSLYEIDHGKRFSANTTLIIPPVERLENRKYGIDSLLNIMDKLTAPDGCEWDKVQTHDSIRINLIEEAYEAVDAINSNNLDDMIEELGDVLLQSVFHCVIAKNNGEFDFSEVTTRLCDKLVTRHTHVFGSNKATDAASALGFWEKAKASEKQYTSLADQLQRIPQSFPSLLRAQKFYKKLLKNGVVDDLTQPTSAEQQLFIAVAECAKQGLDAEVVLREYCNKILNKVQEAEKISAKNIDCSAYNENSQSTSDALGKKSLSELLC